MRPTLRRFGSIPPTTLLAALLLTAAPVPAQERTGDSDGTLICCFANQRFAGECTVQTVSGETCGDILASLNRPHSGRTQYCGATEIRRYWTEVECDATDSGPFVATRPLLSAMPPTPAPSTDGPAIVTLDSILAQPVADAATPTIFTLPLGGISGVVVVVIPDER
jgi:hypothetical protein